MTSLRYALKAFRSIKDMSHIKTLDDLPPSIKPFAKIKENEKIFQKVLNEKLEQRFLGYSGMVHPKVQSSKRINTTRPLDYYFDNKVTPKEIKELKKQLSSKLEKKEEKEEEPFKKLLENIENEEQIRKELEKEDIGEVSLERIEEFIKSTKNDTDNLFKNNLILERMMNKLNRKSESDDINIDTWNLAKEDRHKEIKKKLIYFTREVVDEIQLLKEKKGKEMIEIIKRNISNMIKGSPYEQEMMNQLDKDLKDESLIEKVYLITQIPSPFKILESLERGENQDLLKEFYSLKLKEYLNIYELDHFIQEDLTIEEIIKKHGKDYLIIFFKKHFNRIGWYSFYEIPNIKESDYPKVPELWQPVHELILKKDFKSAIELKKNIKLKDLLDQVPNQERENWKEFYLRFEETLKYILDFNLEKEIDLEMWKERTKQKIEKEGIFSIMKWDYVDESMTLFRKHNIHIGLPPISRQKGSSKVPSYRIDYIKEVTFPSPKDKKLKKVNFQAKVSNFGFSFKAMERFKNIVKNKYDSNSDTLNLSSEVYPTKELNEEYCVQLMLEIIKESKKADQGGTIDPDVKRKPIHQMDQIKQRLKSIEKEDLQSNTAFSAWAKLANQGIDYISAKHTYGLFEKREKEIYIQVSDEEFENKQ